MSSLFAAPFSARIRSRFLAAGMVGALAAGMVAGFAAPAYAALPAGPVTTGATGDRPGGTELPFSVSDRVSAFVDVATGNLRVANISLSLVGVTGDVGIGESYNSLSTATGSTSTPAATGWTLGVQGVGSLQAGQQPNTVVYTSANGATWLYTPSGTAGVYIAPAGAKADLTAAGSTFTLTGRESRQVTTFHANGYPTSIADRNGNTTTLTYDPYGRPTGVTSSAGPTAARTAVMAYTPSTYALTATQTNGASSRSVKWVKNSTSNLTSIVDAENKTTAFGYTGNLLTTITDPEGAVTTITYETGTTKRVLSVSQANTSTGSPGTSVTRFAYPSATQRLVARPNTNQAAAVSTVPHVTFTVDPASQLVTATTDELGRQQAATYTPNGDVASSTSGTGAAAGTTTSTYGANGGDSKTGVTSPGGSTGAAAYGNTAAATKYLATSTTDSAGSSSTYTYNGAGNQLTSTNTALAATATLTFNTDGTVATALAPGNGTNKTVYSYNANKQLTGMTPVTGSSLGARAFTYDDFGRLRTTTNGRGVTTTYSYDKQDRLLSTAFTGGTATVTNTYTATGLPKTRVDGNGTTTYGYDQLSRLTSRVNTYGGGTITYGYDKASNLTTVTDTRGTTTNSFDDAGVPTKITYVKPGGNQTLLFGVDDRGRRTDTWLQSNADHTWWTAHTRQDYDTSGRVSRSVGETRANGNGAVTVTFDTSYCYNTASVAPTCGTTPANDRTKLQWERDNLTGQSTAYAYDQGGKLLSATQTGGTAPITWTYTYDARGNRLTATTTGGTSTSQTLTYNAGNQVTNAGFTFDGTGNLTADTTGGYTYNGAEQMTSSTIGGATYNYKYAGTSQIEVLRQEGPARNYELVYGRTNPVGKPVIEQVKMGAGTAYIENDPVTGQPLMLRSTSGVQTLYVYDGLGSPVGLLTDFATESFAYNFDPFGVETLDGGSPASGGTIANPFLFKGGTQDRATGWVLFGNRWYNPDIGRWTQQDTLDAPLDPTNGNRYAYAGGDPINNIDPTGKLAFATAVRLVQLALLGNDVYALLSASNGVEGAKALFSFACGFIAGAIAAPTVVGAIVAFGGCFLASEWVGALLEGA